MSVDVGKGVWRLPIGHDRSCYADARAVSVHGEPRLVVLRQACRWCLFRGIVSGKCSLPVSVEPTDTVVQPMSSAPSAAARTVASMRSQVPSTAHLISRLWAVWVVERTFAWLHGFRRLRIRWERRADIHEAFLRLACCLITHRQINSLC